MNSRLLAVISAASLLAAASAAAAAPVTLATQVFKETTVRTADGRDEVVRTPAAAVTPGDRVLYVMTYRNGGDSVAERLVITNPVPASVEFLGSEAGSTPTVVSTDGTSFGPLERATVKTAEGAERPAGPADVTHVRWVLNSPVPAGGEGEVSYRAKLK